MALIADVPVCHHNQIRGGEVSEVGVGGGSDGGGSFVVEKKVAEMNISLP